MTKKLMMARRFITTGVLSAFVFVGIANVNAQLSDGLIGYWPLDEGDGTTAANAAGGEDAELYNGVEWVDDADRGMVLSFDGVDGYADAGAETIPQMTQDNDFTWSVWINQGSGNGPKILSWAIVTALAAAISRRASSSSTPPPSLSFIGMGADRTVNMMILPRENGFTTWWSRPGTR